MSAACDVFLSFKNLGPKGVPTRDSELARQIHDLLTDRDVRVFCSSVSLEQLGVSAYKQAIDSALDSARILIAVGTKPENLDSPWVIYECNSFLMDILSRKKPDAQMFVYLEHGDPNSLPRALRQSQTITLAEGGLQRLVRFVENGLRVMAVQPSGNASRTSLSRLLPAESSMRAQDTAGYVTEQLAKFRAREAYFRAEGKDEPLLECIEDQIRLINPQADPDEFMRLLKEQERLFSVAGNQDGLAAALANQLRLLLRRTMFEAAIAVATQLEALLRNMGSKVRLQDCLGWQAEALLRTGDPQAAMRARKEEETLAAAIADEDGMANSLGGQAEIHQYLGDAHQALDILKQQEAIYRSRTNHAGLGRCLFNQARILAGSLARPDEAVELGEKSLRLARNHGLQGLADEIDRELKSMKNDS